MAISVVAVEEQERVVGRYLKRIWPTAFKVAAIGFLIIGLRFGINLATGHVVGGTILEGIQRFTLSLGVCLLLGVVVAAIGDWADRRKVGNKRWND
jgi:hypothetical protein